jgi:hypothetical protein
VFVRDKKAANLLGFLSILFSIVPIVYIFHADRFPHFAQTEAVVIIGGISASFLAALIAGAIGSGWWYFATLAGAMDVVCLWLFNP